MASHTIVAIGTGPSLTIEQIEVARCKGFTLYGCNLAYRLAPDIELLYAVNLEFWKYYWSEIEKIGAAKWTTNRQAAEQYRLHWIAEKNADGLSTDRNVIHHGHGSGFSLVSMAHRAGAKRIVLLGYDLRYASDYDGRSRSIGSSPRHSVELLPGGEYPASMQHWPSVQVKNGDHVELVRLYRSVRDQGLVELVNATPNSALEAVLGYTPIENV